MIAKFAIAAVPGGGILVMLPVLEKYLGFNSDMPSLITALYILFDIFFTMANVLSNGDFTFLYTRFYKWIGREKTKNMWAKRLLLVFSFRKQISIALHLAFLY